MLIYIFFVFSFLCCVVLCCVCMLLFFVFGWVFFDNVSSAYDELLLKPSSDISKVKRYDSQIMSMFWGHE